MFFLIRQSASPLASSEQIPSSEILSEKADWACADCGSQIQTRDMPPSPRIREVHSDGDELEEEDDDVLADFAFERGTGIVGVDHLARVASAEKGSPDAKAAAGPSSSFGDDPGVAATMAVARMMSATGAKSLRKVWSA